MTAKDYIRNADRLKSDRVNCEANWQNVRDYARPSSKNILGTSMEGQVTTEKIFDGTPGWAIGTAANGMISNLCSQEDRWFALRVNDRELMEDEDVLAWLETVSDIIYMYYSSPRAGFSMVKHENFLDLFSFGNAVAYQDRDYKTMMPMLQAFPIADCCIDQDCYGRIDTLYRDIYWNKRQAMQHFKGLTPRKITQDQDESKKYHFLHAVHPRDNFNPNMADNLNMPFASVWLWKDGVEMVNQSGYREFPYHVVRAADKMTGEIYGRGPTVNNMMEIKMVNEIWKTIIKSAQKQVDPPIVLDDDGFLLPIKTSPSSLIFKEPGTEMPQALLTHGQVNLGIDLINKKLDQLYQAYWIDLLRAQRKKERQSVPEIADDRDEQHRLMGAMIGRTEKEYLGPMLSRSYNLLDEIGKIPRAPDKLILAGRERNKLSVEYLGQAARAQLGGKIQAWVRLFQNIQPIIPLRQDILDNIDLDVAMREMMDYGGVSRKGVRSRDAVAQIRQMRKQMENIQQAVQMGQAASSGIKNVAQAQQALSQANQ